MVSNAELKAAFDTMIAAKGSLADEGEKELEAKENLKNSESRILFTVDPKELGSNEAIRQASIRSRTQFEHATLEKAELSKRKAALAFEIACMKRDCLIWQIRNEQASADCESVGLGVI